MALAEHEIAPPEVIQSFTIRLTETQAAKLREAAAESRQSVEEFIIAVSVRAADALHEPVTQPAKRDPLDSIFGIFKDSPELAALMERIHEDQRQGIEQFRLEAEAEEATERAKAQQ